MSCKPNATSSPWAVSPFGRCTVISRLHWRPARKRSLRARGPRPGRGIFEGDAVEQPGKLARLLTPVERRKVPLLAAACRFPTPPYRAGERLRDRGGVARAEQAGARVAAKDVPDFPLGGDGEDRAPRRGVLEDL